MIMKKIKESLKKIIPEIFGEDLRIEENEYEGLEWNISGKYLISLRFLGNKYEIKAGNHIHNGNVENWDQAKVRDFLVSAYSTQSLGFFDKYLGNIPVSDLIESGEVVKVRLEYSKDGFGLALKYKDGRILLVENGKYKVINKNEVSDEKSVFEY